MLIEDLKPFSFLLGGLSEAHRELIHSSCREVSFPKNTVILQQEEDSFDLYILISGQVKVSRIAEDGREVILAMLKKGDIFGELSLLDQKSRSAMVSATTDVRLLFLPRDAFLKIIRENSDLAITLLAVLSQRLRKANETIQTLTFLDVAGRVAKIIIDLAKNSGEPLRDGFVRVPCPTHQTIANQIGSSRESVTKAIKSLVVNGLISMNGKEIIISARQFELL